VRTLDANVVRNVNMCLVQPPYQTWQF